MKISSVLRLEKFYILLFVEVIFLLISSLIEPNTPGSATFTAFGLSAIIIAAINSLEEKEKLKRLAFLAVVVFILLISIFQINQHPLLYLSSFLMFFLLFVAVDVSIMNNLMRAKEIKISSIAGSLAGYLMIGISYAFLLVTLGFLHQEPLSTSSEELGFSGMLYFAFTTMTTIGYGDIVPIHGFTKISASIIGVISQFYIAVVVAVIIGKLMNQRKSA